MSENKTLSLADLKQQGAFVVSKKELVTIEYQVKGEKYSGEIYIVDLPYRETREAKDEIDMIVKSVRLGAKGDEQLTREMVSQMRGELVKAIASAVYDHNHGKKKS